MCLRLGRPPRGTRLPDPRRCGAAGVKGPQRRADMRSQATRFGAELVTLKVSKVDFSARPVAIWIGDPDAHVPAYTADSVIVSTGARSVLLGLEAEQRLVGHGLSTCATCDGFFFRDQEIAVVGGGDSALEEAGFLTKFASKVTLVHRRDALRASKIMQQRAFDNPRIEFAWNTVVVDVVGDTKVEALALRDTITGEERDLPVTGVFIAIGHRPNTDLFVGQLDMDDAGYLITGDRKTACRERV